MCGVNVGQPESWEFRYRDLLTRVRDLERQLDNLRGASPRMAFVLTKEKAIHKLAADEWFPTNRAKAHMWQI